MSHSLEKSDLGEAGRESRPLKTEFLSKEAFRERYGEDIQGHSTVTSEGERTITFPGRPSTGGRLHELYHAVYSPRTQAYLRGESGQGTIDDFVEEELEAIEFSQVRKGKDTLPYYPILGLATSLLRQGYSESRSLAAISRGLKALGYSMPDSVRKGLWKFLRDTRKDVREGLV